MLEKKIMFKIFVSLILIYASPIVVAMDAIDKFLEGVVLLEGPQSESPLLDEWEYMRPDSILNTNPNHQTLPSLTGSFLENSSTFSDYYSRGLMNIMQIPSGERITPAQMRVYLLEIFELENPQIWKRSNQTYICGFTHRNSEGLAPLFYTQQPRDGSIYMMTAPVHDLDSEASTADQTFNGNLSQVTVIEEIMKQYPEETLQVFMPLAQVNSYCFGLTTRNHWVLMSLKIMSGQVSERELYDPKGYMSGLYPSQYFLSQQISELRLEEQSPLMDLPPMQTLYCGHQGLFNFKDCGRFVLLYLYAIFKGSDPLVISTGKYHAAIKKMNV